MNTRTNKNLASNRNGIQAHSMGPIFPLTIFQVGSHSLHLALGDTILKTVSLFGVGHKRAHAKLVAIGKLVAPFIGKHNPTRFSNGQLVDIRNADFRGEIAIVVGAKLNLLGMPLVIVIRVNSDSNRTLGFYPGELTSAPNQR